MGTNLEYRILGNTGFKVPVLTFGTATFGGGTEFFKAWGSTDVAEATRMVDLCLEAGVNMFDTADAYSLGMSEEILGKAIEGRRDEVLISTKANSRTGPGENDLGSSRYHLMRSCEASLRRLGTDHVELFYLHAFDNLTAVEEVLRAMEDLVRSGKVLYIGCSNFAGWQLMKSLGISEKSRHAALCGAPGVLFAVGAGRGVGAVPPGHRPEGEHDAVEPARLGQADGEGAP